MQWLCEMGELHSASILHGGISVQQHSNLQAQSKPTPHLETDACCSADVSPAKTQRSELEEQARLNGKQMQAAPC